MKKDVILFAATLAMMSLTSCSDTPDKPHVESSKPESSQTENADYNFQKEFIRDTSEFNFIQGMSFVNNRIFLYGVTDTEVEVNEYLEFINTKTNQTKKFDIDLDKKSIDRYCIGEKGIYISYADKNYETRLALVDSKTGKIISDVSQKVSQKEIFTVTDMYVASDGKLYVIKTNLLNTNREFLADIYSDDLELEKTINISQKLKMNENEEISGIVSCDRSLYYMLTMQYDSDGNMMLRIHKFNLDFSIAVTYDLKSEKDSELILTGIFSDKSGQLYISSEYMQTSQKIYQIDLNNLTVSPDIVLENALVIYQGTDDYDIIYRTNSDEEIHGYNFLNKEDTVLCSLENSLDMEASVALNGASYGSEILISTQNENLSSERVLSSSDINGNNGRRVRIPEDEFAGYTKKLYITDDGDIYCFYTNDSIDQIIDTDSFDTEEYEKKYFVCHYTSNGKLVNSSELTDYIGSGENISVDTISSDISGNIFIVYHTDGSLGLEMTFLLVCDSDGNMLLHESLTDSCNCACIINSENSVVVAGNDAVEFFKFDVKSGTVLSSDEIKTQIRPERIANIYPGQGAFDFYYADNRTIYGYQTDSDISEKIFDKAYISDGINNSDIQMFCPGGEKDVICSIYDDSDDMENEKLYIFKRK